MILKFEYTFLSEFQVHSLLFIVLISDDHDIESRIQKSEKF